MKDLDSLDWERIVGALDDDGFARTGPLLDARECAALVALYETEDAFRSRVIMARHGFGKGEYK